MNIICLIKGHDEVGYPITSKDLEGKTDTEKIELLLIDGRRVQCLRCNKVYWHMKPKWAK